MFSQLRVFDMQMHQLAPPLDFPGGWPSINVGDSFALGPSVPKDPPVVKRIHHQVTPSPSGTRYMILVIIGPKSAKLLDNTVVWPVSKD
ncbi:hypothetical protein STVA_33770 [Allostella vacuolata]|nr:hypothetical protein STVA_33770 [Stella vacuolata]